MHDGARDALLGYLYQAIGVSSLRAVAVREPGGGAWAWLTASVASGRLEHERFGQDAVVTKLPGAAGENVAIQYKHSLDITNAIATKELIEILHGFEMSRQDAGSRGVTISRYVLVTNRTLDDKARDLVARRNNRRPPKELVLPLRKKGKVVASNRRLLTHYNGKPQAAAAAWHAVLRVFEVVEGTSFRQGLDEIQQFAHRHGVLPDELGGAIDRLIGALLRETAVGPVEVTVPWLKRHLVGADDAGDLSFGSAASLLIVERVRRRLENYLETVGVPVIRRSVLDDIRRQLAQFPVVFLIGEGGCGKSVSSVQYLLTEAAHRVGLTLPGHSACEQAVAYEFNRLRSPQHGHQFADRTLNDIVARLRVANPTERLVLAIDVDALDEPPPAEQVAAVRQLVSACWSSGNWGESGALLLVSYRPDDRRHGGAERALASRWFSSLSADYVLQRVGFVHVGGFNDDELAEAAEHLLAVDAGASERRLLSALRPDTLQSARTALLPEGGTVSTGVIASLKHPVVWGAYAGLAQELRARVLSGEQAALDTLAESFLRRFYDKCLSRGRAVSEHQMHAALVSVARQTTANPPFSKVGAWDPACVGHLNSNEASLLFGEAMTYGLIVRDSATEWRWRHAFVAGFLAREGAP
jgi:hypothetical protein